MIYAFINPANTVSFGGKVPVELAYENATQKDAETIARCGFSVANAIALKQGREIKRRVFHTIDDAIAFGNSIDLDVLEA